MDFFATIIAVTPALALTHSGASAFPGVLAFAGAEPVLAFVDVAVNHELSALLVLVPVVSPKILFVWEHLVQVLGEAFTLGFNGGSA